MGRLSWRPAEIAETRLENERARTLALRVPSWEGHRPGQHVDVRLTAEDGYQAVRSYSLAAPPDGAAIALTVERIDDGEVSPHLVDVARPGDRLEVRGPVGGYFVWGPELGGPLLLVGGGSGVAPLMAIAGLRSTAAPQVPARLLYSVTGPDDVLRRADLERLGAPGSGLEVVLTFTRSVPEGWRGHRRRVDAAMLEEVAWPASARPLAYVCGPTGFVESVADALHGLGYEPARIRTERFGPSGGRT